MRLDIRGGVRRSWEDVRVIGSDVGLAGFEALELEYTGGDECGGRDGHVSLVGGGGALRAKGGVEAHFREYLPRNPLVGGGDVLHTGGC